MRAIIRKVKLVNLKKGAWGLGLLFTNKYCCNFDVRAFHIALTFCELNWHVYPLYCSAWDYLFWFAANNIVYKQTSMVLHIRLWISTFLQTFMPSSITVLELCECEQNETCSSRIQGETLVRQTLIFYIFGGCPTKITNKMVTHTKNRSMDGYCYTICGGLYP